MVLQRTIALPRFARAAARRRDADSYVRGHADSAADDVQHFLGWKVSRPN